MTSREEAMTSSQDTRRYVRLLKYGKPCRLLLCSAGMIVVCAMIVFGLTRMHQFLAVQYNAQATEEDRTDIPNPNATLVTAFYVLKTIIHAHGSVSLAQTTDACFQPLTFAAMTIFGIVLMALLAFLGLGTIHRVVYRYYNDVLPNVSAQTAGRDRAAIPDPEAGHKSLANLGLGIGITVIFFVATAAYYGLLIITDNHNNAVHLHASLAQKTEAGRTAIANPGASDQALAFSCMVIAGAVLLVLVAIYEVYKIAAVRISDECPNPVTVNWLLTLPAAYFIFRLLFAEVTGLMGIGLIAINDSVLPNA